MIEGNFYSAMAAGGCGFDVLDLYYHFRFATHHRQRDGIHWNSHVHRWLSHLLLTHVADAWGVHVPDKTQRLRESGCATALGLGQALEILGGPHQGQLQLRQTRLRLTRTELLQLWEGCRQLLPLAAESRTRSSVLES